MGMKICQRHTALVHDRYHSTESRWQGSMSMSMPPARPRFRFFIKYYRFQINCFFFINGNKRLLLHNKLLRKW